MKKENDIVLPSYPMVLVKEDIRYVLAFCKMYQAYYTLPDVKLINSKHFGNHFIEITENEGIAVSFSWLEFVLFEIVGFINTIITESNGVYKKAVDSADLLIKMDFEALWEQIEDWASDLSLEDFQEAYTTTHLDYVFKIFKCTEHYITVHKEMPKELPDELDELCKMTDEYYTAYIPEENLQISTGVPGTIVLPAAKEKKPILPALKIIKPKSGIEKKAERKIAKNKEKEEIKEEDRLKVNMSTKTLIEYGIYTT